MVSILKWPFCSVENRLWERQGQKPGVRSEAILVIWVRGVGCIDECGVDEGGDMWSNKGHILKLEPKEIANESEMDVRDTTMMTNSSSQHWLSTGHMAATALRPLQVKIQSVFTGVP